MRPQRGRLSPKPLPRLLGWLGEEKQPEQGNLNPPGFAELAAAAAPFGDLLGSSREKEEKAGFYQMLE
jgi:hypothetical protein